MVVIRASWMLQFTVGTLRWSSVCFRWIPIFLAFQGKPFSRYQRVRISLDFLWIVTLFFPVLTVNSLYRLSQCANCSCTTSLRPHIDHAFYNLKLWSCVPPAPSWKRATLFAPHNSLLGVSFVAGAKLTVWRAAKRLQKGYSLIPTGWVDLPSRCFSFFHRPEIVVVSPIGFLTAISLLGVHWIRAGLYARSFNMPHYPAIVIFSPNT